jgi:Alcohol dehydrogenase GroES-like domain
VRRCSATSARGPVLGENPPGQDVHEAKQPQARVLARTLAIAAEREDLKLDRTMLADRPLPLEEVELPEPAGNEVLVRIRGGGICHTDLTAQAGGVPLPLPAVLGHEGAGVVEAVGSAAGIGRLSSWLESTGDDRGGPVRPPRAARRAWTGQALSRSPMDGLIGAIRDATPASLRPQEPRAHEPAAHLMPLRLAAQSAIGATRAHQPAADPPLCRPRRAGEGRPVTAPGSSGAGTAPATACSWRLRSLLSTGAAAEKVTLSRSRAAAPGTVGR